MSVVRLIDRAPVAVSGQEELFAWLKDWVDALAAGDFGEFRSIVLVLESADGPLASISQSLVSMDGYRVAGMLNAVADKRLNGGGNIMDLRK